MPVGTSSRVRPKEGPGQRVRDRLLRIAALASCLLAGSLTSAGEIRAGFTVSVQLLDAADAECSLAARTSTVLVDCGTVTVIPVGAPSGASSALQRTVGAGSELAPSFDWGGYFQGDGPRGEAPLELLPGTLRRPDEEQLGRADPRIQTLTGFSEYSARTVLVGNLEYVEMTVSW
jgi:hypothetical protein